VIKRFPYGSFLDYLKKYPITKNSVLAYLEVKTATVIRYEQMPYCEFTIANVVFIDGSSGFYEVVRVFRENTITAYLIDNDEAKGLLH
jgi:hypothetical protein